MRTLFKQKEFGECYYACMANLFNDESWLEGIKDLSKGVSFRKSVALTESRTKFSLFRLLTLNEPSSTYIPVFELDEPIGNENEDYYICFLASLKEKGQDYSHCVLIIKENFNDSVTVLDPKKEKAIKICIHDFWKTFNCTELDVFSIGDRTAIFSSSRLSHLLDQSN